MTTKFQAWYENVYKDPAALGNVIRTFTQTKQLQKGKQLHAQLTRIGYSPDTVISNHLLNMYAKCGELSYAHNIFDKMPERNIVSWTAMITGFSQNMKPFEALRTFCSMRVVGISPTQFAFCSVVKACISVGLIELGGAVHTVALKCGFAHDLFVGSNLADMYSKFGSIGPSCRIFEEIQEKDVVSWTAMIDAYAKSGKFEEALLAYKKMISDGFVIDQHVFSSTLSACGGAKDFKFGGCLHSSIVKLGFEFYVSVGNALIYMYSKIGDMESASNVFGIESEQRNVVSFSSLINGYVQLDQIDGALGVFVDLLRKGIKPNEFTFSSLINGCANLAALEQGTQLHAQVVKVNFDTDPYVSSILVDMYGKCGLLDHSIQVFDVIGNPRDITWNALIGVFAQHGFGKDAIRIFDRMIHSGVRPNEITFVSLLVACSRARLVEEGLNFFYSMEKTYEVVPQKVHYTCVIDLLGRAGRLREAEYFIIDMPFEPNAYAWCSFLAACGIHGDKVRAKRAADILMYLEPENSGAHVLLSNIYAKEGQWEDVRNLRKKMSDGIVKKLPGYSWVDLANKTYTFGVQDWSNPRKKEIYQKLDWILDQIKKVGYVPLTESIPLDIDDKEKEWRLHHHSERIAIAFALISMPPGKPIIVKKNLRVCADCHSAIKYISKVVARKIIVRDNTRFHHFIDGSCSCGDFW